MQIFLESLKCVCLYEWMSLILSSEVLCEGWPEAIAEEGKQPRLYLTYFTILLWAHFNWGCKTGFSSNPQNSFSQPWSFFLPHPQPHPTSSTPPPHLCTPLWQEGKMGCLLRVSCVSGWGWHMSSHLNLMQSWQQGLIIWLDEEKKQTAEELVNYPKTPNPWVDQLGFGPRLVLL